MRASILETIVPQFIVDNKGKKTSVVLDIKTFKLLVEELEDAYDVRTAEKIIKAGKREKGKTLDELEKSLRRKN